jgi:adenylate cyclase
MLAIMCQYDRPLNVLTSSITYVYFLDHHPVIAEPRSHSVRVHGTLAPWATAHWSGVHGNSGAAVGRVLSPSEHLTFVMRSVLLFGGGLAAAFVSQRIRTTIVETIAKCRARAGRGALWSARVARGGGSAASPIERRRTPSCATVCVMVLDIRDFTAFSETRAPDEVGAHLNTLWTSW